jgi:hypothetical protein
VKHAHVRAESRDLVAQHTTRFSITCVNLVAQHTTRFFITCANLVAQHTTRFFITCANLVALHTTRFFITCVNLVAQHTTRFFITCVNLFAQRPPRLLVSRPHLNLDGRKFTAHLGPKLQKLRLERSHPFWKTLDTGQLLLNDVHAFREG